MTFWGSATYGVSRPVRAITDEVGAPVIRHDYRPFGENNNDMTGDPIRFAGKELDPETGQQYFDARYYRNTWGRFSAVDPLHVGAAMTDPQQWNRYAYARNNPLRNGDPSGLDYAVCGSNGCHGYAVSYGQLDAWAYQSSFELSGPGSGADLLGVLRTS